MVNQWIMAFSVPIDGRSMPHDPSPVAPLRCFFWDVPPALGDPLNVWLIISFNMEMYGLLVYEMYGLC